MAHTHDTTPPAASHRHRTSAGRYLQSTDVAARRRRARGDVVGVFETITAAEQAADVLVTNRVPVLGLSVVRLGSDAHASDRGRSGERGRSAERGRGRATRGEARGRRDVAAPGRPRASGRERTQMPSQALVLLHSEATWADQAREILADHAAASAVDDVL